MQVQNPDYKFYRMLAGTWKSADASCTAELTTGGNIEICYAGARLSRGFNFTQTGPMGIGFSSNNMIGFMGMQMLACMTKDFHEGEELKIRIETLALSRGEEEIWCVEEAWYGRGEIHLVLTGIQDGQKKSFTLTKQNTPAGSFDGMNFKCVCGYEGPAKKFCPECGRTIEKHTCDCGYISIGAKFCPNCGKPTGKTSESPSGKATENPTEGPVENPTEKPIEKKVYEKKELLFAISMSMSTNPPRTDGANVYAYSDTELVLEHGGEQRLISTDVIEPAYEIIRKNRLDDPDFKDPVGAAMMGGTANVGFKNGDQWVNASMYDKGNAALSAYYGLMGLFNNA